MQVRLVKDWAGFGYAITFYETEPLRVLRLSDNGTTMSWDYDVRHGDSVEPSLRLEPEALEALLREAEKVIPATHATERHLTDAVTVRDRLLALVERAHGA